MSWFVLIIWFDGGDLDELQFALPFPSLEACSAAIPKIEVIYANLDLQATYHCSPVGAPS